MLFFFYVNGMGRGCYGNKFYPLISIGRSLSTHIVHVMIDKALLIGHCTLEIYWQLLVKGKGVADCYCLLCICVICLLQIMCGNLVFVISCYNSAWCLVFVWLSSFLGGTSGFKVRFGEHESWRSKEGLYEKVPNVVQMAKLIHGI